MSDELHFALNDAIHQLMNDIEHAEGAASRALNELVQIKREHDMQVKEILEKIEALQNEIKKKDLAKF